MFGVGILGGILTYLSLEFLQGLVKTYGAFARMENITCAQASNVHFLAEFFVCNGVTTGWAVALMVLMAYAALELAQAATGILRLWIEGYLEIKSRSDIEREVLVNLMRKDDQFFQRHSATQITNRLSEDAERIFERREDISELWSVSIQALGALAFLWGQNWSYAAAVLVFSVAGVFVIHRMLGSMQELDGAQLQGDDNVKAAFEDYLYAAPEAQMGNLSPNIVRRLATIQNRRKSAFLGLIKLNSKLSATYALTELVAFGSIMGAIIYVVAVHGVSLEDGLVAAVVRAVPQTYSNISDIAKLFMKFKLAEVSAKRLLEYETQFDGGLAKTQSVATMSHAAEPSAITFEKVQYTFVQGGPIQGGNEGISATIEPLTLDVVVGHSGSGKSMLSQLTMGRLKAASGSVRYDDTDVAGMEQAARAEIFGYMPQNLAMITGTIAENVQFGLSSAAMEADEFDEDFYKWIERTFVGRFAREKALDRLPEDLSQDTYDVDLSRLRTEFCRHVAAETRVELTSFVENPLVPHFSLLENLTQSASSTEALLPLAFSRSGYELMDELAELPAAEKLTAFGAHVIEQTRHILTSCRTFEAYCELAPFKVIEPVWELRSRIAEEGDLDLAHAAIRGDLMLIGLTARPQEAEPEKFTELADAAQRQGVAEVAAKCSEHFKAALEPLDETSFNSWMNWRDNLLFSTPKTVNTPTARTVDRVLLQALADTPLDGEILRSGLQYNVGRMGKRLSGGQRQLVCLCRTLLQGSPVMVLDEPTAALDPERRAEINRLLREVAKHHTIIVITHDTELARIADQVVMMKDGQLWAKGPFDLLALESAEFRTMANIVEVMEP